MTTSVQRRRLADALNPACDERYDSAVDFSSRLDQNLDWSLAFARILTETPTLCESNRSAIVRIQYQGSSRRRSSNNLPRMRADESCRRAIQKHIGKTIESRPLIAFAGTPHPFDSVREHAPWALLNKQRRTVPDLPREKAIAFSTNTRSAVSSVYSSASF